MKKLIKYLLIICLALCTFAVIASAEVVGGKCGEDVVWIFDTSTGELEISGSGKMYNYTFSGDAPWYSYKEKIKKVTVKNGVTSVGDYAFLDCYYLVSIDIPDSVTSLGNDTFWCCYRLAGISIPSSVTVIGTSTFANCRSLTNIAIPDSVRGIGSSAFARCENLTSITIPDSVTSIGDGAFNGCAKLEGITLPYGLTKIDNYTFSGCAALKSISIPYGVTRLGRYAFENCYELTSITVPDTVTSVGEHVFDGCPGLVNTEGDLIYIKTKHNRYFYLQDTVSDSITSCEINKNTKFIGNDAFYNCSRLTSISIPNGVLGVGRYAFCNCNKLTSVIIPEGVTSIEEKTFAACSKLTDISIPDSVTRIDDTAFDYCKGLENTVDNLIYIRTVDNPYFYLLDTTSDYITDCTINKNTKFIDGWAFVGCDRLTSITIPDGITYIDSYVFGECSSLASITIPKSVTSIGESAFYGCDKLMNTVGNLVYIRTTDNPYYLLYSTTSSDITSCTINENTEFIGCRAFGDCENLEEIFIPEGVKYIEKQAFYGCDSLLSVTIPNSVARIDYWAFWECESLTHAVIHSDYAIYGDAVFGYEHEAFTVYGYSDSTAEDYARENRHIFIPLPPRDNKIIMTIDSTDALVFGKVVKTDVPPIIENNRTMLPARFVAEALGATVLWDAATRTATVTGNGVTINITVDSSVAYINGQAVALDSPAFIRNNRTYTPVRFIAEALGASVDWNAAARQAIIIK